MGEVKDLNPLALVQSLLEVLMALCLLEVLMVQSLLDLLMAPCLLICLMLSLLKQERGNWLFSSANFLKRGEEREVKDLKDLNLLEVAPCLLDLLMVSCLLDFLMVLCLLICLMDFLTISWISSLLDSLMISCPLDPI